MQLKNVSIITLPKRWVITAKGEVSIKFIAKETVFSLSSNENGVNCSFNICEGRPPLTLSYDKGGEIKLFFAENRIALYVNGELGDEEWPLGNFPNKVKVSIKGNAELSEDFSFDTEFLLKWDDRVFDKLENVKPYGNNSSCGDCMPFYDEINKELRLFYLIDRRHHKSRYGIGGHRWGQVSTKDFKVWQSHPIAVDLDEQWEGSVCTGSVIENGGVYYAYYSIRSIDKSPAKLTYSVSKDGVHFEKSHKYFTLNAPYDNVSARDPKLIKDENGLFHMIVTTSVNGKGCLAHLTSKNMTDWEQQKPLLVLETEKQPECPDIFFFNKKYYLTYGQDIVSRYYVSDAMFGEYKAIAENNIVVSKDLKVPKSAIVNGTLYFSGFVFDENLYWGGHLEIYSATADSNGILSFEKVQ